MSDQNGGPFDFPDSEVSQQFTEHFVSVPDSEKVAIIIRMLEHWPEEESDDESRESYDEAADTLSLLMERGEDPTVVFLAFQAGQEVEGARLRAYGEDYERGLRARRTRPRAGATMPAERDAIRHRVDALAKNRSRIEAARMVKTELMKGECPGIDRVIGLSADHIRKLGTSHQQPVLGHRPLTPNLLAEKP